MFVPHSETDTQAMLRTIGVKTMEELFEAVPEQYRFPELDLPAALTEMEALEDLQEIASANVTVGEMPSFLGAGAYNHYVPAVVDSILRRGEYYTAYTPYQPEVSQGTLQAIFEYQSMISAITGMDASNASHYDGATAAAEAVNMSQAITRGKRNKVIISPGLHPHYRETICTYDMGTEVEVTGDDLDPEAGPEAMIEMLDDDTALVMVQYPDFYGRVYDFTKLAEAVHEAGALLSVSVNPMALGLLKPPGEFGADIVTGEGQPLGVPLSYGGPYLGILATKDKYVRSLAGRIVGETTDTRGQRGYVLTLSTREQHIRREKAMSNICTNVALIALAATVYISLVGKQGLREAAELSYHKAHYAAEKLAALPGYSLWSDQPFFNEFMLNTPKPAAEINEHLLENGILGGLDVSTMRSQHENALLLAFTEMNSREDIDRLIEALAEVQK
ncbi:MAG: aminomethyl-transferring glycine dehydrogenase subunit GcvPA [Chloroflexi bacterium]|nr:MAG: aminomethyl-transferring glycine dehydrogenase subunit GcvPA [Chloroflexota bacterium]MBL1195832.1 aminomethyl-transferring glycine dehydrogenase subunit GcvPA [Chloroflexota bacterium]NOH13124.1 aminomethyl-transferring glycine dehydrogenase subunit GcvPA [Chloroflexota bacterium]